MNAGTSALKRNKFAVFPGLSVFGGKHTACVSIGAIAVEKWETHFLFFKV